MSLVSRSIAWLKALYAPTTTSVNWVRFATVWILIFGIGLVWDTVFYGFIYGVNSILRHIGWIVLLIIGDAFYSREKARRILAEQSNVGVFPLTQEELAQVRVSFKTGLNPFALSRELVTVREGLAEAIGRMEEARVHGGEAADAETIARLRSLLPAAQEGVCEATTPS